MQITFKTGPITFKTGPQLTLSCARSQTKKTTHCVTPTAVSTVSELGSDRGRAGGAADVRAARRREKKADTVETIPAATAAVTAATATPLATATNVSAVACFRACASARGSESARVIVIRVWGVEGAALNVRR